MTDKIFKTQSPFSRWSLFNMMKSMFLVFLFLLVMLFAATIPEYNTFGIVGSVIMIVILIWSIWSKMKLRKLKYIIDDRSIQIPGNRFVHRIGEIPFDMITDIEIIPAPKNIFEGLFTRLKGKYLFEKTIYSISSTGVLRDVVLIHTNYKRGGIFYSIFVLSPEDKEDFVRYLKKRVPSLKKSI